MSKYDMPDALQAARVKCSQDRPYLASLLLRLTPIASPGLKTMAVDKFARLYFDPEVNWTVPQMATVLYHECCHLLRDHAGRGDAMGITQDNAMAWNVVCDAEINDDIEAERNAQWPFPCVLPGTLNPPQKNGGMAEEYYATLPKQFKQSGGNTGEPKPGAGHCGGAAGNPGGYEEGPPPNSGGKKDAAPGIGEAEMDAVKHKVASDIREHVKQRGNVPGHLQEWAQHILEPVVDWTKVLRSAIRHAMADVAGMSNYSYQRPSRRQNAVPKVVLPSMRQPVPKIAVVIDTSGSMSGDDLAAVLGEVNGVLRQCGQKEGVEAIVCDAEVHSVKKVFRADQITLAGRGGTDMRLGIEAALSRPVKPHAVIVLTDGYTPWPDQEPHGVKVIAALVGQNRIDPNSVPVWIRTVVVDKDK